MKNFIDINSDIGEIPDALLNGTEEKLISLISSANIACGGHAGNEMSIKQVMQICKKYNVAIGAHPSFPDKENFGRVELAVDDESISEFVFEQVNEFIKIARELKLDVNHIKPHGALYNAAAKKANVAIAISNGIKRISKNFILYGLAGSIMLDVWKDEGFDVAPEAFADRYYEDDGSLRSRKHPDSLITNSSQASLQALKIVSEEKVVSILGNDIVINASTICIHSDTADSIKIAQATSKILTDSGITIRQIIK